MGQSVHKITGSHERSHNRKDYQRGDRETQKLNYQHSIRRASDICTIIFDQGMKL